MSALPPLPGPPALAGPYQPFWDGVARGRLELPRCRDCGRWVWYPADRCPGCGRLGLDWTPIAGTGTVFTFTVVHRSFISPAPLDRPFAVGLVELDEAPGVRLVGLLGGDPGAVGIGTAVRVAFIEGSGRRLPVWIPEAAASRG
jgi:uncharacterized protein